MVVAVAAAGTRQPVPLAALALSASLEGQVHRLHPNTAAVAVAGVQQ
jgi:hypothetical protein